MTKRIQMWLGIIVAVFVIIGGLWRYDQYKADASEVQAVNEQILLKADSTELQAANEQILLVSARLNQKIINDNIRAIQQRIWDMQMYYQKQNQPIPPEVQQQIRKMEYDIQQLKRQLGQ